MVQSRVIFSAFLVSSALVPISATAGEELLLRQSASLTSCRAMVANTLNSLKAPADRVRVEVDTGALYRLKVVSSEANLVFLCNGVAEQISISRSTPGELRVASQ
jgi:hypothetical protein